jgi:hypothetical protein
MEGELKPCPFCGGSARVSPISGLVWCDIGCFDFINHSHHLSTLNMTAERWNNRPIEDQQHAEILRLRNALTRIANSDGPRNITTGEGHSDCVYAARRALVADPK